MTFDAVSVTATPALSNGSDPEPEPEPEPERLLSAGSNFTIDQNYNYVDLIEGESLTLNITRTTHIDERDYFYIGFETCEDYGSPCPTDAEFTTDPPIDVFPNGAPWEFSLQPPTANYMVFEPGQTTATITISSITDDETEENENRILRMVSYNDFYTTYQQVTFVFKEIPPPGSTFAFVPETPYLVTAAEGTQFSVNVLRSGRETDLAIETTVTITTRPNGSGLIAASEDDYTVSPTSITFLPGETLKTFTVSITQDEQTDEQRELFIVSLQTTEPDRLEGIRTAFIVRIPATLSPSPSPSPSPTPDPNPTPNEPRQLPTAYRTDEGAIIIVTGQVNQQVQITYNNFYNPRVPIRPIECSEPIYQFWNTQRFQVTNNQITIYNSPQRGVIGPPGQVPVMARFVADDIPTIGLVLHRFADTANGHTTVCEAIATGNDITWTPIGGGVSAFRARVTGWRDRGAYVSSHYTIMTFLRGLPPGEHTAVDGHRSVRTQTGNSCGVTVLRPTNSYPAWAAEGGFEYGGQQWNWNEMAVRRVPRCEQGAMYYPLVDRGNGVIEGGLGEY